MKTFATKFVLGMLLVSAGVFASAYGGPASQIPGDGRMARALRHLDLSEKQVWRIKDIMRQESGRNRNSDIRGVLSPGQRRHLDEVLRHERR